MQKVLTYILLAIIFQACSGGNAAPAPEESIAPKELIPQAALKEYKLPELEIEKCQKPRTVKELSGGMQKVFYMFNADNAKNLSLFGGATGTKIGKKESIVIVDFMQHKDLNDCDEPTRYGLGVRLFLKVKKASRGIDLNNLPQLAASVQLGKASVQYTLQTIGVTGDKINALIPRSATNSFDVEGYAGVVNAVDKIQSLIKDGVDGVVIDPQLVPINRD